MQMILDAYADLTYSYSDGWLPTATLDVSFAAEPRLVHGLHMNTIRAFALGFLVWPLVTAASEAPITRMINSSGDVPIALTRWGNPDGPDLLLVHSYLSSTLNWGKQRQSTLGERFDIAALDMRGHGSSGKPIDGTAYAGTKVWGDDIANAIAAAEMDKPIVVTASFGGTFVMDYVRHYGTENISGVVFAASHAGLIPPPPPKEMTPVREDQIARNQSANLDTIIEWTEGFFAFMTADKALPADELELLKLSSLLVPHYVRPFVRERSVDNSDLRATLKVPVLFVVGTKDVSASIESVTDVAADLPNAKVLTYEGANGMLYWYEAERLNADIAEFAAEIAQP